MAVECPRCQGETEVIYCRPSGGRMARRLYHLAGGDLKILTKRRRKCVACGLTFTTGEIVLEAHKTVARRVTAGFA